MSAQIMGLGRGGERREMETGEVKGMDDNVTKYLSPPQLKRVQRS